MAKETILPLMTLEKAERMLPKIEKLMLELHTIQHSLDLLETVELEVEEESVQHTRYITRFNKAFHRLSYDFFHKLDQIERLGGVVKDVDEGLVDFISEFQGRNVLLCWQFGEEGIHYWHEIDTGYEERQPILKLNAQKSRKQSVKSRPK